MVLPGFIDLQVNGFGGVDFSSPALTAEDFAFACRGLQQKGTAAFLATLITSPREVYQRNLALMAKAIAGFQLEKIVLGFHLEGPFISSAAGAVGAHNPAWVQRPDPALLDCLQEWADGRIRLITIAADVEGAEELCCHAVRSGIVVSLGHHLADAEQITRLADAGASALTHFGNGIPNLIHRHQNPLWPSLAEDRLMAMLITDGHHLPPAFIRTVVRAKGVERSIIVSDASPLAGMPPGRYSALGNEVILEESGLLHNPAKGCMVGSSATIRQCVNYLANLGDFTEPPLRAMALDNPLRLIGLTAAFYPAETTVK